MADLRLVVKPCHAFCEATNANLLLSGLVSPAGIVPGLYPIVGWSRGFSLTHT